METSVIRDRISNSSIYERYTKSVLKKWSHTPSEEMSMFCLMLISLRVTRRNRLMILRIPHIEASSRGMQRSRTPLVPPPLLCTPLRPGFARPRSCAKVPTVHLRTPYAWSPAQQYCLTHPWSISNPSQVRIKRTEKRSAHKIPCRTNNRPSQLSTQSFSARSASSPSHSVSPTSDLFHHLLADL